jgi:hypothetical protein
MDDDVDAPRFFHPGGGSSSEGDMITTLDSLIIPGGVVKNVALSAREIKECGLVNTGAGGDAWRMTVKIYDMQYDPKKVVASPDELALLPPSVVMTGEDDFNVVVNPLNPDEMPGPSGSGSGANNTGVYLVRASLTVNDNKWILESAIMQSNNM